MLLCNEDDEPGAINRCAEPNLKILRLYREKHEIMSLVHRYEYAGAWEFCKGNPEIPDDTKKLIKFAMYRADLQTKAAQQIMRKYCGQHLFPFSQEAESLVEYLLTMQIHQEKGQYASFMVQISPFLYELFLYYAKQNLTIPVVQYLERDRGKKVLKRSTLVHKPMGPELLEFLDEAFKTPYRDGELSFILLYYIFVFALTKDGAIDGEKHRDFMNDPLMNPENKYIDELRKLRNNTAHEIVNVSADTVKQRTGMNPSDIMQSFWHLLSVILGLQVNRQRSAYRQLNQWIDQSLLPGK